MKIAFISDIHGNLPALKNLFSDLAEENIDRIINLGDTIGYGDSSWECFMWSQNTADINLQGNHEYGLFQTDNDLEFTPDAVETMRKSAKLFSQDELEIIKNLPIGGCFDELDISFAHDSFSTTGTWRYVFKDDAPREIKYLKNQLGFLGHSHEPFIFSDIKGYVPLDQTLLIEKDEKCLINVGSVGHMRGNDKTKSYYGLLTLIGGFKLFTMKCLSI